MADHQGARQNVFYFSSKSSSKQFLSSLSLSLSPRLPSSCPNITWLTDHLKSNRLSLSLSTAPPPPPPISITFSQPPFIWKSIVYPFLSLTPPPTPHLYYLLNPPLFENQLVVYPFHPPPPTTLFPSSFINPHPPPPPLVSSFSSHPTPNSFSFYFHTILQWTITKHWAQLANAIRLHCRTPSECTPHVSLLSALTDTALVGRRVETNSGQEAEETYWSLQKLVDSQTKRENRLWSHNPNTHAHTHTRTHTHPHTHTHNRNHSNKNAFPLFPFFFLTLRLHSIFITLNSKAKAQRSFKHWGKLRTFTEEKKIIIPLSKCYNFSPLVEVYKKR